MKGNTNVIPELVPVALDPFIDFWIRNSLVQTAESALLLHCFHSFPSFQNTPVAVMDELQLIRKTIEPLRSIETMNCAKNGPKYLDFQGANETSRANHAQVLAKASHEPWPCPIYDTISAEF